MGLFSKKQCSFCGNQVTGVASVLPVKTSDKHHICHDCLQKVSNHFPLHQFTYDETLIHMEYMTMIQSEGYFTPSCSVWDINGNEKLSFDLEHKRWKFVEYEEVFSFDELDKYWITLWTTHIQSSDRDHDYIPKRDDFPPLTKDCGMHSMNVNLRLKNHPYLKKDFEITLAEAPYDVTLLDEHFDLIYQNAAEIIDQIIELFGIRPSEYIIE